jgi:hypothetical protein
MTVARATPPRIPARSSLAQAARVNEVEEEEDDYDDESPPAPPPRKGGSMQTRPTRPKVCFSLIFMFVFPAVFVLFSSFLFF